MLSREQLLIDLKKQFTRNKFIMNGEIKIFITTVDERVYEFKNEVKKEFVVSNSLINNILAIYDSFIEKGQRIKEVGIIANMCYSFKRWK